MLMWGAVYTLIVKIQNNPCGSCQGHKCQSLLHVTLVVLSQHGELDSTDAGFYFY